MLPFDSGDRADHRGLGAEFPFTLGSLARLPKQFATWRVGQHSRQREQQKGTWEQLKCGRLHLPGPKREVPFIFMTKYPWYSPPHTALRAGLNCFKQSWADVRWRNSATKDYHC